MWELLYNNNYNFKTTVCDFQDLDNREKIGDR